ncbi:MAG: hypothetical protein ACI865_002533 [Flavobacteriaceae bacterium]|jgi:hypothetical protein
MEGGVNYHYDLAKEIYVNNFDFGLTGTLFFTQWRKNDKSSKVGFGINLQGTYSVGRYVSRSTFISGAKEMVI